MRAAGRTRRPQPTSRMAGMRGRGACRKACGQRAVQPRREWGGGATAGQIADTSTAGVRGLPSPQARPSCKPAASPCLPLARTHAQHSTAQHTPPPPCPDPCLVTPRPRPVVPRLEPNHPWPSLPPRVGSSQGPDGRGNYVHLTPDALTGDNAERCAPGCVNPPPSRPRHQLPLVMQMQCLVLTSSYQLLVGQCGAERAAARRSARRGRGAGGRGWKGRWAAPNGQPNGQPNGPSLC